MPEQKSPWIVDVEEEGFERVEFDVDTYQAQAGTTSTSFASPGTGVATAAAKLWSPPAPLLSMPAVFPDRFVVLIFRTEGGPTLVAAVEFVSPSNKDRPEHRRAFVTKCSSYLHQGISLGEAEVQGSLRE
jgi:hypothetical protein